jgi:PKHD-type hydroxylase
MFYEGAVSPEICNRAIERFEKNNYEDASVGGIGMGVVNKQLRDTDRQWAPPFDLLECILTRFIQHTNIAANWNFDITQPENVQIGKYKVDQFYKQHVDIYTQENIVSQRKISASLFLSPADNYEGGELKILNEIIQIKTQGTIVVFPSFVAHEVMPVTRGERMSAVCWMGGPNWK